tara:strand:+ start:691 stop:1302 length:612 start_codon:yes stop_codon:yes gene_type:complete
LTHTGVDVVTNAIGICIFDTVSTANAQGIKLVAVAVTISFWDACTTAWENGSWTIAHATSVKFSHTVIHVVANAIGIDVGFTVAPAFAERIKLISVAIAIADWDVRTSALIYCTWAIANATSIVGANAVVDVITDAIGIGIRRAIATTLVQGVELVALAIAISFGNAAAATNSALVKHIARTVALSFCNALASAHATLIQIKA